MTNTIRNMKYKKNNTLKDTKANKQPGLPKILNHRPDAQE